MRAALINNSTNLVENVIELEVEAQWEAPTGYRIVFSEVGRIGQLHYEREFREPA